MDEYLTKQYQWMELFANRRKSKLHQPMEVLSADQWTNLQRHWFMLFWCIKILYPQIIIWILLAQGLSFAVTPQKSRVSRPILFIESGWLLRWTCIWILKADLQQSVLHHMSWSKLYIKIWLFRGVFDELKQVNITSVKVKVKVKVKFLFKNRK